MTRLARRRPPGGPLLAPVLSTLLQQPRLTAGVFNRLYYGYSAMRRRLGRADNVEPFLRYNFDASFTVPPPAAVCGPHGYAVQVAVDHAHAATALPEILRIVQAGPSPPVTAIMRLHRADDHPVSFALDGCSLNFEFHVKRRHATRMRATIDDVLAAVIAVGGRVHLAKDAVLTAEQFRRLHPRWRELIEMKRRLDPGALFASDLQRRLLGADASPTGPPDIHVVPGRSVSGAGLSAAGGRSAR